MSPSDTKLQKGQKEAKRNEVTKQQFKLIVRRLPSTFTKDELMEQIEPLEGCNQIWVRKANKSMDPWLFTCAYLSFDDWEKAVQFSQKFNGYVFIDKQGNESAAIVELAMHQQVPENFMEDAGKNDRRVGSLEQRSEYKKFLDEYNNLVLQKVTNFDELIREVEEKEKRVEKGTVETPLVKSLLAQAFEKEKKRLARLEKHKPSMLRLDEDGKKRGGRDEKKNRRKDEKPKKPNEEKDNKRSEKPKDEASKSDDAPPPKDKRKRSERPKRSDDSKRSDEQPKRSDDSAKPATNGTSRRKPKDGPKTKEYAEFGNVKPKLLSRNQKTDNQESDLPKNDASTDQTENDVKNLAEKLDDLEVNQSNGDKNLDDKRRRHAQRPERPIYRPPRNRDKRDRAPKLEKEVAET